MKAGRETAIKKKQVEKAIAEAVDDLQWYEAFKGKPSEIAAKLPRDEKGLETRLDKLYEFLARNSDNAVAVAFARARIEQIGRVLDRINSRRVSAREWLSFIIAAGGLLVAAGGVLAAILKK